MFTYTFRVFIRSDDGGFITAKIKAESLEQARMILKHSYPDKIEDLELVSIIQN